MLKANSFEGKVMIITGGTSNMLYQTAFDFMNLGGNVALVSRRLELLEKISKKLNQSTTSISKGYKLDLKKATDSDYSILIDSIIKDFGRIDILINGAAGNFLSNAENLSLNAFKTVIEIDTIGTFLMCKHVYSKYMKYNGGTIINISASLHYLGTLLNSHASAAKAAIDAITKTLALEWGPKGVRVNGVAPGVIEGTEGFDKLISVDKEKNSVDVENFKKLIPLQRYGNRKDVANTVMFLISDLASYITGQTILVDGGQLAITPNWLIHSESFLKNWTKSSKF